MSRAAQQYFDPDTSQERIAKRLEEETWPVKTSLALNEFLVFDGRSSEREQFWS